MGTGNSRWVILQHTWLRCVHSGRRGAQATDCQAQEHSIASSRVAAFGQQLEGRRQQRLYRLWVL